MDLKIAFGLVLGEDKFQFFLLSFELGNCALQDPLFFLVLFHFLGKNGDLIHASFTTTSRCGLVSFSANSQFFCLCRAQIKLIGSGLNTGSGLRGTFHIGMFSGRLRLNVGH